MLMPLLSEPDSFPWAQAGPSHVDLAEDSIEDAEIGGGQVTEAEVMR